MREVVKGSTYLGRSSPIRMSTEGKIECSSSTGMDEDEINNRQFCRTDISSSPWIINYDILGCFSYFFLMARSSFSWCVVLPYTIEI